MAPIVTSIEIARPPGDVFAYVIDPSRLTEWQERLLSSRTEGGGAAAVGSRVTQSRRVGRAERTMTSEITEINPPRNWAVRGVDGPVRGMVKGTVEPLDDGARWARDDSSSTSRGHGIGRLLVPLVGRRQTRQQMPTNMRNLKQGLEGLATARQSHQTRAVISA